MVTAGTLPPLDERLPTEPAIYPIPDQIGQYGGTIRRGMKGAADRWGPSKVTDVGLTHFNYTDLNIRPDLLDSWELSEDGTTFTLNLRRGVKWSDGEPVDSSTYTWYYEYVYQNDELTPNKGSNPYTSIEAPDDFQVVVQFQDPNPLWLHFQNRNAGEGVFRPGHYMKDFHPDTAEDQAALDKTIEDAGFTSWTEYFGHIFRPWNNPELPQVRPWVYMNTMDAELLLNERNPYFHAVDPEGNQIPYIDKITHRRFDTPDVFNMWIVNGEIDWQRRHVSMINYTLYKESEDSGDYQVILWKSDGGETLCPNHDCKDPKIKEFFNDLNVRKALNLAVDRVTINEVAYDGLGTPRQASPTSFGPFYHEEATNAYTDYDPDRANELLDEAGYSERNADGFRLWKDGSGEAVFFVIEGTAEAGTASSDAVLMVVDYFKDVGVNCSWKQEDRALYEEHHGANETQASWWGAGHDTLTHLTWGNFFIGELTDRPWAGGYGRYYRWGDTDPNANPPPEGHWLWDIWEWWREEAEQTADLEVIQDVMNRIMDVWVEQVPVVGILGEIPSPIIVKDGLMNMLADLPASDRMADESLIGTPILFWDEPDQHS
jgi:peptide/nickel transport system substrate-binding protein